MLCCGLLTANKQLVYDLSRVQLGQTPVLLRLKVDSCAQILFLFGLKVDSHRTELVFVMWDVVYSATKTQQFCQHSSSHYFMICRITCQRAGNKPPAGSPSQWAPLSGRSPPIKVRFDVFVDRGAVSDGPACGADAGWVAGGSAELGRPRLRGCKETTSVKVQHFVCGHMVAPRLRDRMHGRP